MVDDKLWLNSRLNTQWASQSSLQHNPSIIIGYLLEVFFRLCILHFCLQLVLETWAKASLTHSLWIHDPNHTHSIASFQGSRLSDQQMLCLTKNFLPIWKWWPHKGRGVVAPPICAKNVRNGPSGADQGWSTFQPRQLPYARLVLNIPAYQPLSHLNRLHQLITCCKSQATQKASLVVKGLKATSADYTVCTLNTSDITWSQLSWPSWYTCYENHIRLV